MLSHHSIEGEGSSLEPSLWDTDAGARVWCSVWVLGEEGVEEV